MGRILRLTFVLGIPVPNPLSSGLYRAVFKPKENVSS